VVSLFAVSAQLPPTTHSALSDALTNGKVPVEMSDRLAVAFQYSRGAIDAVIVATQRKRTTKRLVRALAGLQWIVPRHASRGGSIAVPA
jgi:hypothetical protein